MKAAIKFILDKYGKPTLCELFGHKKIYLEKLYEREINGWFCDRCNLTYDEDNDKYY